MYKRIVAVCLSCLLLFSVISMPARAEDYSADGFYIDLCELFGYDSQTIASSGGLAVFSYALANIGMTLLGFDFEICVVASGAEPVLYSINPDVELTISNTVNGFFARGTFDGLQLEDIFLYFTADGYSVVSVLSFKVYLQRYLFSNFAAVVSSSYSTAALKPGGSVTVVSAPINSGVYLPVNYSIKVSKTYWADMDYMEFSCTVQCLSIDSISAYSTADNYLPIDINYIEQGYNTDSNLYDGQWFYVSGSVDLSSMDDVNTLGDIQILISCVGASPESVLTVTGLRGIHYSGSFNTDLYWFNKLALFMFEMNTLITTSVDVGISNLGQLVTSGFDSLVTFFTDSFMPDLKEFWISVTHEALLAMELHLDPIIERLDDLIDALSPDPVDQEVTDGMGQAGSELGGMTEQMQQSSPDISVDDVNVDVGALVDTSGMASATALVAVLTGIPFVENLLLIASSFALIGFVFFGKR